MNTQKRRRLTILVAVFAAMTMLFTMVSVSFAGGENGSDETVCVNGYVINHREQAVDGTEFTPQMRVFAIGVPATFDAAELPDLSAEITSAEQLETLSSGSADSTAASSIVVQVAKVDSDGYWEFEKLPAGYYYAFALPLPVDWDGIVPEAPRNGIAWTGWAQLDEQDDCYDILFKIRRWFDVTVIKWEELLDGTVQRGEGWEITAIPQGDPWAIEQQEDTGVDGTTVLPLTPGTWMIKETVQSGWTPVTPSMVYLTLDQYAPPGATDPVVFKNREPACYASITVKKDGVGTNAKGGTEWLGPLAGWKFTLSRPDGMIYPVTKTTNGSGTVTFKNLKPGVYNVKETVQPGWEAISANPQIVVIRDCEDAEVLFENLELAGDLQISGTKYFRAWVPPYQGQTVGLSGWTITATLKGTDPAVYVTTQTNALGKYTFSEATLDAAGMAIPGATITVCEEERDHWIPVTATCVDVTFPYPVPASYTGAKVNFTNMQDPPPGGAAYSSSASSGACALSYTVRRGDSLSAIAAANGTTVSALTQRNGLANPNMIRVGQTLCVQ
ncbi:MAG: LysM peptidoglycan-binding domain-containing protein [Caldilineae bacterium]|nr:LysM peptidoglycan-binding domain-containing protein [Anaerolineae bacterium]MCB0200937.1 LysM peptidoglycan-binding domain-containing protein [Anaerolineae bacterium]MCB0204586.1 LysM peptidoglycan-binding domain-containing protein [Anaerolineae bacterium]MCB0252221.1 LysM peptidoglycan-binding domain-containing protein [Anaerolineae bacterium]MCB9153588.1 LysM peptidoglycan-binding domain-containing protein [Caldilineae bacterium]